MKAVIVERYGSPEVLGYREVPQPKIKPNHLLVKIHATSVNPLDFRIRRGELRIFTGIRKPKTQILGFDVAAEVVQIGEKTKTFKKGDEVFALMGLEGGAYAEYIVVPEQSVALKPVNMSFEEAAAVPLAGLAALQALRDRGKISSGKKVLIHGASGGVGTFAVQIAKSLGAVVTGVCSSKNVELVKSIGADEVIDYTKDDFTKRRGTYDIVFDVVAKKSFSECKRALTPKGIYITTVPNPMFIFQSFWTHLWCGKKATFLMVRTSGKDLNFIRELIEAGKVKSIIDKIFSLPEVASAHAYCEEGHTRGKTIIRIS
jgi:NADPH:quinone reductase-like Zn-dependent oxidoreductase